MSGEEEVERLHSWAGLLELLDEHWPEDIFPTEPDSDTRDPGPRIVSLLRWVERLQADLVEQRERHRNEIASLQRLADRFREQDDRRYATIRTERDALIDEVRTLQGDLEEFGEAQKAWLQFRRERDALKAAILDIDAHATPYGDIPDDPGYVGTYLLTAGALHRALGKIGHSAPKCQAEAVVAGAKALAEQWIGNQDAGTIGDSIRADAGRQILAHLRALGAPCSHRDAS